MTYNRHCVYFFNSIYNEFAVNWQNFKLINAKGRLELGHQSTISSLPESAGSVTILYIKTWEHIGKKVGMNGGSNPILVETSLHICTWQTGKCTLVVSHWKTKKKSLKNHSDG